MPGPMLEHNVALLTYLPSSAKLAFNTAVIRLDAFSTSASGVETALADGRVDDPGLVDAEFHFAGLYFEHRFDDVGRYGSV